MKAARLDHVSVTVTSIVDLTGVAGARFSYADLDLGSGQILELLQYEHPLGVPIKGHVYDPGSGHIAVRVEDLDETLRRLKRAGISPRSAPMELRDPEWWRGARCVYLSDPDGVIVELVERSAVR